ncbi:hypothetical protein BJ508DRAFT_419112 [Ascobolus immersus RN42]|uniref:Sacsin/Nov domain-containing protein n=1 Tax=Ascobolus immersus RN42 TaxID=1160509 RepID=A0A3N4HL08_ASCIM|nr:hypothetical protein BJ508DRAFT_419112 [Ascobolus immersus RN42]
MAHVDYNALRNQTLGSGRDEEAVTVNTRALIDKVLARYSGEYTTLRELLQNAADANATEVEVRFTTMDGGHLSDEPEDLKLLLKQKVKRMVVKNNGQAFREEDWQRLKRIAEGNPDETKIGAFGVGFYSVFADCEEPFISSGSQAMAFYWKGNQLFTRRATLEKPDPWTVFFLDNREPTDLPDIKSFCRFLATSITFVSLTKISLFIDDHKILVLRKKAAPSFPLDIPNTLNPTTSEKLMTITAVNTESVQIDAEYMNLVEYKEANAVQTGVQTFKSFWHKFTAVPEAAQSMEDLSIKKSATIFLRISTASVKTSTSAKFAQELERATKKPPPKVTNVAFLSMSKAELDASEKQVDLFENVYPHKEGRIFIGFPTHQTTSIRAHISASSVIPTVERESIDLNARIVKVWNQELLQAAGILARIVYQDEMASLAMLASKRDKAGIKELCPTAIHIMNQFTFLPSTPSETVGRCIEQGFWTCSKNYSIDLLSTKGVRSSAKIRVSKEITFLENLALLPEELEEGAPTFINLLKNNGILLEVTVRDVAEELGNQALTKSQATTFLKWASLKAAKDPSFREAMTNLFNAAVIMVEESEAPIPLAGIKHAIDPSRIPPTGPFPDSCIPFGISKTLTRSDIEGLGWTYLDISDWVAFLCNGRFGVEHDLNLNPQFSQSVLVVICKSWTQLSKPQKEKITALLSTRTCITTKNGQKKPSEAYIEKIKLFEDLPVVLPFSGLKTNILAELGVRKTVELSLVLTRLMNPGEDGSTWSHIDLVKYLTGVREDIPSSDLKKLKDTPICPAEGEGKDAQGHRKLYRVRELYQPDEGIRRLGLPIIDWKGERIPHSELKFLVSLGLQKFPDAAKVLFLASNNQPDIALRNIALQYFISKFQENGYVNEPKKSFATIPFLPADPGTGGNHAKDFLFTPTEVFLRPKSSVLKFPVLRKDLYVYAQSFGVKEDPPIQEALKRLANSPPETAEEAKVKFGYFAFRVGEINSQVASTLASYPIVPVEKIDKTGKKEIKRLPPRNCYIGGNDSHYRNIFDFVDFGREANAFLMFLGTKAEPTPTEIAYMCARDPDRVLGEIGINKYLSLLKVFSESIDEIKKDAQLLGLMRTTRMLLATNEPASTEEETKVDADAEEEVANMKVYELAKAQDIYIIDDFSNFSKFRSEILAAPQDDTIEMLYARLGSLWLSNRIQKTPSVGAIIHNEAEAARMHKLILERVRLFIVNNGEPLKKEMKWIEKSLNVTFVQFVNIKVTLLLPNGDQRVSSMRITATSAIVQQKLELYLTPNPDFFHVSEALVNSLLKRPKSSSAFMLTNFFTTDLMTLRQRGINVDRILKARKEEARLAEEARLKENAKQRQADAEAAEQRYKAEQEKARQLEYSRQLEEKRLKEQGPRDGGRPSIEGGAPMPGAFQDSPPRKTTKESGGFFKGLTKRFGLENQDQKQQDQLRNLLGDSKGSGNTQMVPHAPTPGVKEPIRQPPQAEKPTEPHRILSNLHTAINRSRAHNSNEVVNEGKMFEVKEDTSYCDKTSSHDIVVCGETPTGMKAYLDRSLVGQKTELMSEFSHGLNRFAVLLEAVASVFEVPKSSLHIYYNTSGESIAFNLNGAMFFNFRFYKALHLDSSGKQEKKYDDAFVYWFVTMAHELSHNLVKEHSAAHSFYTESLVQEYFIKATQFMASRATRV